MEAGSVQRKTAACVYCKGGDQSCPGQSNIDFKCINSFAAALQIECAGSDPDFCCCVVFLSSYIACLYPGAKLGNKDPGN